MDEDEVLVTEPVTVNDTFITSTLVEVMEDYVRITGFCQLLGEDGKIGEKRIVSRSVYPIAVAREMNANLRRGLTKGGH